MKNSNTGRNTDYETDKTRDQDLLPLNFAGDNIVKPGPVGDASAACPAAAPPAVIEEKNPSSEGAAEGAANAEKSPPPGVSLIEPKRQTRSDNTPESTDSPVIDEDFSFGKYLQEKRVDLKLSTTQVEGAIKIRKSYIEALESEDFSALPPPVFTLAYIRKICSYYGIAQEDAGAIADNIKHRLRDVISDELPPRFHLEREGGEDNERKLRRLIWGFVAAIVCFVLLVTVAVLMIATPSAPDQTKEDVAAGEVLFDADRLNRLLAPQTIEMTELPPRPGTL